MKNSSMTKMAVLFGFVNHVLNFLANRSLRLFVKYLILFF